jgi:hypothetical protein
MTKKICNNERNNQQNEKISKSFNNIQDIGENNKIKSKIMQASTGK